MKATDWINVNERLPERDEIVLVAVQCTQVGYRTGYRSADDFSVDKNGFYIHKPYEVEVLAWMPIPEYEPYKEETMDEQKAIPPYMDYDVRTEESMKHEGTLVKIDLTQEVSKAKEIEVILGDYEFVLKDGKTYFVKKKPQYPKTYEECCEIMGIKYPVVGGKPDGLGASTYRITAIRPLIYLLICRDAYWKIAGEQMGWGKPWEPDWDHYTEKYVIYPFQYLYSISKESYSNRILTFPTEEMRDAFFENFKDLIEQGKELL